MKDYEAVMNKLMGALRQLENTPSTRDKKQLIAQYYADLPEFKLVLLYALDPYRKFGINRWPSLLPADEGTGNWFDILYFLKAAVLRDTTPLNTVAWLKLLADKLSGEGRELLKRIVLKDLRCGVGSTLVNSVIPGLIPEFGLQLATPLEEHHVGKLAAEEQVFAQPKLNGDRVVAICPPNTMPELFSRKGHVLLNYTEIAKVLYFLQKKLAPKGIVFDGEVIQGNFFKTRSVKKLAGNEALDAKYYIFDCVPYVDWRKGETEIFSVRNKQLREIAQDEGWQTSGKLERVGTQKLIDISMPALEVLRDKLIEQGYEGLMIRPDLPYNFKTRSSIYKLKKMDTMDCVIMEVLPGEAGKKHQHHAGSMLVELPNGQTCKTGLRLGDVARDKLWAKRSKFVGLVAEISYQDKTVNKSGQYKLQFPVFVKIRKDKS
jgi:DNA ligase-1